LSKEEGLLLAAPAQALGPAVRSSGQHPGGKSTAFSTPAWISTKKPDQAEGTIEIHRPKIEATP